MTLNYHHLPFATKRQYFLITAFCLSLCWIVACYVNYSAHSGKLSLIPAYIVPKQKAFSRIWSFVGQKQTTNANSRLPRLEAESTANNDTDLFKTDVTSSLKSSENEFSFIDVDKIKPPLTFLYERLTLVTSFSQNHFQEGLGFIGTAQQQMPNKTIIVYDLGLDKPSADQMRSLCNVKLRRFPFENYPIHVKKLTTYAFKPTIINLVLDEFAVIYYGDSSIRFKKPLFDLLPHCVNHHGFLGQIRCFDAKVPVTSKYGCHHDYHLTQNGMYDKIGVNKSDYYNANFSSPVFSGGLMLVVNSTTVQSKIMKPWLRCALDVTCIAPTGANLQNHRFDQSALSMLLFKNMRNEWKFEKDDPTPHYNAVVFIARGSDGSRWNPKTCKHL